ncbi:hypothetical protein F5Y00DRAFT_223852 [Daldinia vernicosa]|uniref:uncharacterized protein n=1 Tax=Daldinia vernicosa TaxID=114800 RepID=UPI002007401D|nr:uncharacterized protein F5Y00DRAFT_223852 [Daldinia vernicosa]KAI0853865.1 hypothetical protein F5Y00DRAFT_223852 [Daldinia vernicosa]
MNRSAPTDSSPLDAATSFGAAFLYMCIIIYSCICVILGFKVSQKRWKRKTIMGMPPPIPVVLGGVLFTLFFLAFLIPILIVCTISTALDEYASEGHHRRPYVIRRMTGASSPAPAPHGWAQYLNLWDLNFNLSSSDRSDEITTISSHRTNSTNSTNITNITNRTLPHYEQRHRDNLVEPEELAPPETPPPVYFPPGRASEETLASEETFVSEETPVDGSDWGSRT